MILFPRVQEYLEWISCYRVWLLLKLYFWKVRVPCSSGVLMSCRICWLNSHESVAHHFSHNLKKWLAFPILDLEQIAMIGSRDLLPFTTGVEQSLLLFYFCREWFVGWAGSMPKFFSSNSWDHISHAIKGFACLIFVRRFIVLRASHRASTVNIYYR